MKWEDFCDEGAKLYIQELEQQLHQKENIIKELYTKANDTNITSLDLREYILDKLGSDKR